jgi:excisionase family DNA binding protein
MGYTNRPMAKKGTSVGEPLMPVATVSVAEAARVMGIGSSTAYRLIEADEFPVQPRRVGGTWKILRADLERWAAGDVRPVKAVSRRAPVRKAG